MHNASALLNLELTFQQFSSSRFFCFFFKPRATSFYLTVFTYFRKSEIVIFYFCLVKIEIITQKVVIWRLFSRQIGHILVTNCNWTAKIQQNWSNLDSQNATKLIKVANLATQKSLI